MERWELEEGMGLEGEVVVVGGEGWVGGVDEVGGGVGGWVGRW